MTLPAQPIFELKAGNGVTTAFPLSMTFYDAADLVVSTVTAAGVRALKVLNVDYTVTGGNGAAGTVTTTSFVLASGNSLLIEYREALEQALDLPVSGNLPATAIEARFDRIVAMVQNVAARVTKALRLPDQETAAGELPEPLSAHANDVLVVNSTGTGFTFAELSAIASTTVVDTGTAEAGQILGWDGTKLTSANGDWTLRADQPTNSTIQPRLRLFKNDTGGGASGDQLGAILFQGPDNVGNRTDYAQIRAKAEDATNGAEDGELILETRVNNAMTSALRMSSFGTQILGAFTAAAYGYSGFTSGHGIPGNIKVITGSGTYTKPADLKGALVMIKAGGGGSGGCAATAGAGDRAAAGGGGEGEFAVALIPSGSIAGTETVTIGAGGAAGAAGAAAGGTGGTTSFGTLLTAIGGQGGQGGTSTATNSFIAGGAGGLGGAGSISALFRVVGDDGGNALIAGGVVMTNSGHGGGSHFASRQNPGVTTGSAAVAGKAFGGGAAGGTRAGSSASLAGASGASGICIVLEMF